MAAEAARTSVHVLVDLVAGDGGAADRTANRPVCLAQAQHAVVVVRHEREICGGNAGLSGTPRSTTADGRPSTDRPALSTLFRTVVAAAVVALSVRLPPPAGCPEALRVPAGRPPRRRRIRVAAGVNEGVLVIRGRVEHHVLMRNRMQWRQWGSVPAGGELLRRESTLPRRLQAPPCAGRRGVYAAPPFLGADPGRYHLGAGWVRR